MNNFLTCENTEQGFTCYNDNSFISDIGIFTSGEMVISSLLFILVLIELLKLALGFFKDKTKRKYLGVNQMEGKEIYDI